MCVCRLLKNAPSVFQRFVCKIFREFIESGRIMIYMDDIIIASKTFSEHLELQGSVLLCVSKNGLEPQLTKCHFGYREI